MEPVDRGGGRARAHPRGAARLAPSAWFGLRHRRGGPARGPFEARASSWTVLERCARVRARRGRASWTSGCARSATAFLAVGEMHAVRRRPGAAAAADRAQAPPRDREGLVVVPAGDHFDAMVVDRHPRSGGPLARPRPAAGAAQARLRDDEHAATGRSPPIIAVPSRRCCPRAATSTSWRRAPGPGPGAAREVDQFLPLPNERRRPGRRPCTARCCTDGLVGGGRARCLPVFADVVREMHADADNPARAASSGAAGSPAGALPTDPRRVPSSTLVAAFRPVRARNQGGRATRGRGTTTARLRPSVDGGRALLLELADPEKAINSKTAVGQSRGWIGDSMPGSPPRRSA